MTNSIGHLRGLASIIIGLVTVSSLAGASFLPALPEILSLRVEPTTEQGQEGWVEFSWQTSGATRVRLYRDGREVKGRYQLSDGSIGWPTSLKGGFRMQHRERSTYELVAENEEGKAAKTVVVPVGGAVPPSGPPRILSFSVSPAKVKAGGFVKFFWKVEGADTVRLYDNHREVKSRIQLSDGTFGWPTIMAGSFESSENQTTTYRLVATNARGETTKNFRIDVLPAEEKGVECTVNVDIRGLYAKHTSAVWVFDSVSGRPQGQARFEAKVRTVRDHRPGKDPSPFQGATITVPRGDYYLVPRGGGRDSHGYFGVDYTPHGRAFTCGAGAPSRVSFKADAAEY